MTIFDEATAVSRRADGRYDAEPDVRFALVVPGASTPPAVNGGALLATVMRAVLCESPHPHPVATSAHFLRVPRLAPAQVEVSWLKQGGTAATARAALIQDGKVILDTTVTTGRVPEDTGPASTGPASTVSPSTGPASTGPPSTGPPSTVSPSPVSPSTVSPSTGPASTGPPSTGPPSTGPAGMGGGLDWTGPPPGFPAIADCVDLGKWPGTVAADGTAGYAAQVEVLMDPATTGWRRDDPSGVPEMRGYFRLRDDRAPDALLLAMAVDGLPPVVFGLGATGWAPTVELTWHMRAVPRPGPLAVQTSSRHVSGGWFDEEAEVWDSAGRLVAQSRQLARVGRGPVRANGATSAAAVALSTAAGAAGQ